MVYKKWIIDGQEYVLDSNKLFRKKIKVLRDIDRYEFIIVDGTRYKVPKHQFQLHVLRQVKSYWGLAKNQRLSDQQKVQFKNIFKGARESSQQMKKECKRSWMSWKK